MDDPHTPEGVEQIVTPAPREHPLFLQGRRHARDVLLTAERIGRLAQDQAIASQISTAMQLVMSAALVDGREPHEVYEGLINAATWAVCRLPKDDRIGVLAEIVRELAEKVAAFPDLAPSEEVVQ